MNDESYIKPFLKWAGGKRRLLPEIRKRLPEDIKDCLYCEPFIGGGAVLLDLQPKRAIINDCNCELINCFQMVKQSPEKLVKELETYENTPEFFTQFAHWTSNRDFMRLPTSNGRHASST